MRRRLLLILILAAQVGLSASGRAAPAALSSGHALKSGETVASVAETYYGNRHYDVVIIKLNRLKDPANVPAGTVLRIPELKEMLLTEGFPKDLAPELDQVVKARYSFIKLHEELERALRPGNSEAKVRVPAALRATLLADADAFEKAGKVLAKQGNFGDSATRMRQRLGGCAELLRQLALGVAPQGAEDRVHALLAQAFVRGLKWAHNEDGDVKEWTPP